MSAPSTTHALIPPATALASIATWSLSAALCLPLLVLYIGPQAIPRTRQSRFIAPDSSLRYVRVRARLLFLLALANLLDALNNAVHFTLAWQCGVHHVLAHRLALACTFSAIVPLSVLCLSYRCAVIVVDDPEQRTKYVLGSQVACFCAWALHASGVVYQAFAIVAAGNVPVSVQLMDRWVPLWATVGMGLIPLVALGGSVWSLRMVRPRGRGGKVDNGSCQASATSARRSSKGSKAAGTGETVCESVRPPDSPVKATAMISDPAVMGQGPISLPTCGSTPAPPSTTFQRRQHAQIDSYPLNRTFLVLTCGISVSWIASFMLAVFPMVGPVRNNALLNLVMTMTIALESSYERLLKMHHRRKPILSTRGGGGGNGEMVGESVLDVARMSTHRI